MTQAQYKALMARRQQLLNKTSDISGNENLLLNKQDRRVTFENDTKKAIIEPNTAEVIDNNVNNLTVNKEKNTVPPRAIPNNAMQTNLDDNKSLHDNKSLDNSVTNKVALNYEFLMKQQKEIINNFKARIERLEKQLETQMTRHELKNSKNEEMIVTLNTTINNLSEILRNNFSKTAPPTLDAELQTEKQENEKMKIEDEKSEEEQKQKHQKEQEQNQEQNQKQDQDQEQNQQQDQEQNQEQDKKDDETINVKLETSEEQVNIKLEINNN